MKILSSQVVKAPRVTSESLSRECPDALQLSPNWTGMPQGDISFHGNTGNALDKDVCIATNDLKEAGYRLRQNENAHKRCIDCTNYWPMLCSDNLNVEEVNCEALLYQCLEAGGFCDGQLSPLLRPTPEDPARSAETGAQIREYRKSLSVRWGSLKWSLDLVMVVKSRSSSKSSSRSNEERISFRSRNDINQFVATCR